MGFWNLYFAAKLYAYAIDKLEPIWWLNLVFALALLAPLPNRRARVLRQALAVVAGAALLYHEARLPPIGRALAQIPILLDFTLDYWLELLERLVPMSLVKTAVLAVLAYLVINRWVRVTTFIMLALVVIPLWQGFVLLQARAGHAVTLAQSRPGAAGLDSSQGGSYDQQLAAFRAGEKDRRVDIPAQAADAAQQFDLIVLHICSLSWDDIDASQQRNHPLLSRFDYVFKNFSSAASYSGPAAIRVMRAACGQESHEELYSPLPPECRLFAQLARSGYTPQTLLNHNGQFDDFRGIVEREIGVPGVKVPSLDEHLPIAMREFDNSPVVGDYDTLSNWYQARLRAGGGPVALYYNTVSLHDGNRLPNVKQSSTETYPRRLATLFDDVDRLIELIAQSGRKAVVVFVPEHGAALRGGGGLIAGMREVPTPAIVSVPVGVKLIGLPGHPDANNGSPTVIDAPTSYLALVQLLANLVGNSPFRPGAQALAQYAADLPQTRLVGENEGTVVMALSGGGYATRTPDDVWSRGN